MRNMLRNLRRGIALILACAMAFSTPMTAFAGTEETLPMAVATEKESIQEALPDSKEILGDEVVQSKAQEVLKEEIPEEPKIFEQSKEIDGVIVKVTADEGVFPEDAWISVSKVIDEEVLAEIDAAIEEEQEDDIETDTSYAFDIKVYTGKGSEAKEIQPDNSKGSVKVTFAMTEKPAEDQQISVFHVESIEQEKAVYTDEGIPESLLEDEEITNDLDKKKANKYVEETVVESAQEPVFVAEELDVEINTEDTESEKAVEVTVEAESFSYYVVRFTYNSMYFTDTVNSETRIENILPTFGISFSEIIGASVSNAEYAEAYIVNDTTRGGDNGKWMLRMKKDIDLAEGVNLWVRTDQGEYNITLGTGTSAKAWETGEKFRLNQESMYEHSEFYVHGDNGYWVEFNNSELQGVKITELEWSVSNADVMKVFLSDNGPSQMAASVTSVGDDTYRPNNYIKLRGIAPGESILYAKIKYVVNDTTQEETLQTTVRVNAQGQQQEHSAKFKAVQFGARKKDGRTLAAQGSDVSLTRILNSIDDLKPYSQVYGVDSSNTDYLEARMVDSQWKVLIKNAGNVPTTLTVHTDNGDISLIAKIYAESDNTGWLGKHGSEFFILDDGQFASGITKIDEEKYYFDPETKRATKPGWYTAEDGFIYHSKLKGTPCLLRACWLEEKGKFYYFDEDCHMVKNQDYSVPVKNIPGGDTTYVTMHFGNDGAVTDLDLSKYIPDPKETIIDYINVTHDEVSFATGSDSEGNEVSTHFSGFDKEGNITFEAYASELKRNGAGTISITFNNVPNGSTIVEDSVEEGGIAVLSQDKKELVVTIDLNTHWNDGARYRDDLIDVGQSEEEVTFVIQDSAGETTWRRLGIVVNAYYDPFTASIEPADPNNIDVKVGCTTPFRMNIATEEKTRVRSVVWRIQDPNMAKFEAGGNYYGEYETGPDSELCVRGLKQGKTNIEVDVYHDDDFTYDTYTHEIDIQSSSQNSGSDTYAPASPEISINADGVVEISWDEPEASVMNWNAIIQMHGDYDSTREMIAGDECTYYTENGRVRISYPWMNRFVNAYSFDKAAFEVTYTNLSWDEFEGLEKSQPGTINWATSNPLQYNNKLPSLDPIQNLSIDSAGKVTYTAPAANSNAIAIQFILTTTDSDISLGTPSSYGIGV